MNNHDYKQNAYYLIYLIRCVLNDKIPAKEKLDKIDLSQLYEVAKNHSLTAMVAYALESVGIYDERFTQAKAKAIRKNAMFDIERERIFAEFEKAGIWYMPLKGIIMNDLYPKNGMRQMCDNDILVDKTCIHIVKEIMLNLGFKLEYDSSGHDVSFSKPPVLNFEMHYVLFHDFVSEKIRKYYSNISNHLASDDSFCKVFSDEDFYIYLVAHEYKHYILSGIGLRSLVDNFVFRSFSKHENNLDWNYIDLELSKLGLVEFEIALSTLASKVFRGQKPDKEERQLLDYFIFSSTVNTIENRINNSIKYINGSKKSYIAKRVFLSLDSVKRMYPFFYKHKALLPILPVYRLFHNFKKNKDKLFIELKTLIH